MARSSPFAGFPRDTLQFLVELRANNSKDWFDAHRDQYDRFFVQPAREFVNAVGPRIQKLSPQLTAEPRINGSIFRINRDLRFSKDKTPYKDHMDFAFWEGTKGSSGSSLFFRVSPAGIIIGSGFHQGSARQLKAFRIAVADPSAGKELAAIVAKIRKHNQTLHGRHYQRTPRGFADDGPAAEFLLHKELYVTQEEDSQLACSRELVSTCLRHWRNWMPLHTWLIRHVSSR